MEILSDICKTRTLNKVTLSFQVGVPFGVHSSTHHSDPGRVASRLAPFSSSVEWG